MSKRQRMTWTGEAEKVAAQPPANPRDDGWHPAHQSDDPGPHDYENGDTSKWKEDPTSGPYPNSQPPANPRDDGWHPADKAAASKEAAEQIRVAAEKKASKCIRIAEALMPMESFNVIEDQALDFMDLPDSAVDATLDRLAKRGEDDEEDEEVEVEASAKSAADRKIAELTNLVHSLANTVQSLKAGDDDDEEEAEVEAGKKAEVDPDEALLASMLAEEKVASDPDETLLRSMLAEEDEEDEPEADAEASADEALLRSMLAEEDEEDEPEADAEASADEALLRSMLAEEDEEDEPEADAEACGEMGMADDLGMADMGMDDLMDEPEVEEMDMGMGEDPMGLMDEYPMPENDSVLSSLFAEEARAEMGLESDTSASESIEKAATAQKPKPRKASKGPKTVGTQTRTASSNSDLESLWETAPDVSGVFS